MKASELLRTRDSATETYPNTSSSSPCFRAAYAVKTSGAPVSVSKIFPSVNYEYYCGLCNQNIAMRMSTINMAASLTVPNSQQGDASYAG